MTGEGEAEKTRPVSNAEINNELRVLKRMFSLAIEAGKLAYRPTIPMLKDAQDAFLTTSGEQRFGTSYAPAFLSAWR